MANKISLLEREKAIKLFYKGSISNKKNSCFHEKNHANHLQNNYLVL